jgi:hypothetical protein
LRFDRLGYLYVGEGDKIYRFFPDVSAPPTATVFTSGVPGANGLAFDRDGNLWTSDGTTARAGSGKSMHRHPHGDVPRAANGETK